MLVLLRHQSSQYIKNINSPTKKFRNFPAPTIIIPTRQTMASTTTRPASPTPDQRQNEHALQTKKQKRPALTHFLCLPLVSETSMPLLESSLTKFKRSIPSRRKILDDHPAKPRPQLFPDSAVRPLGTLHLTLGVMSLPTPERIEEAVGLLQSLDVGRILQEVESELSNGDNNKDNRGEKEDDITPPSQYRPFSVSLEALHSLPRAKTATVLYAHPVDPTSRLHPFAVKIRNEFVNAGFIEQDFVKPRPRKHKDKKGKPSGKLPGDDGNSNEIETETANANANGKILAVESEEERLVQQKPKFRPLLLHATLVNTIYARRGPNPHQSSGARKGRKFNGPLTFDARDILAHYRDFYTDDTCTQEKQPPADDIIEYGTSLNHAREGTTGQSDDDGDSASVSSEEEAHPSKAVIHQTSLHGSDEHASLQPKYPFIWARNVPIEKLCICEMGAKKPNEDSGPLAARLGQEYRVVAEKKLFD